MLIFILNTGATFFYWYYRLWWFDMLMHFLGGAFVVVAGSYVFFNYAKKYKKQYSYLPFVVTTLIFVSIGWELYELFIDGVFQSQAMHLQDSLSDLCFDFAGGSVALLYLLKRSSILSVNK